MSYYFDRAGDLHEYPDDDAARAADMVTMAIPADSPDALDEHINALREHLEQVMWCSMSPYEGGSSTTDALLAEMREVLQKHLAGRLTYGGHL